MRLLFLGVASGCREILAHKLRSFLTLFGIVLGAAALVGMLGVVKGLLRGFELVGQASNGDRHDCVLRQALPLATDCAPMKFPPTR